MNWEEALTMVEQFLVQLHTQIPTYGGQQHNFTVTGGRLHLNVFNDKDQQWHVFKDAPEDTTTSPTEDLHTIVQLVMEGQ